MTAARRETDAEKIARLEASNERNRRRAARANERAQDLTREAQERGLALARARWDAERLERANANLRASRGATDETLTVRVYIDLNADTDVMTIRQAGKDDLPADVYDVPVDQFWAWATAHWAWHETQLRIVRDYLVPRDKEAEDDE
jgi:hypothetical protein